MKIGFTHQDFKDLLVPTKNGCLEWSMYREPAGYGRTNINGKTVSTHRLAIELEGITIPDGMYVCHHCDNPSCANPDHLFIGSNADNMNDMVAKGRNVYAKGSSNSGSILTEEQVLEMRSLYSTSRYTQRILGDMYGTSRCNVSMIVNRKHWKHI